MKYYLACLLLFSCLTVFGQDKMSTDRPDQTDGAVAVNKGHLQFESQLYYTSFHDNAPALVSASLFRYGLVNRLELRLNVEQGLRRSRFINEGGEGGYPLGVGLKYTLLTESKTRPAIGVISLLQLPFTNGEKEPHYWSPAISLSLEKQVSHLSISTNVGLKQHAFDKDFGWAVTGDLKYELSEAVEVFIEYFAEFSHDTPAHHGDGGLLLHLNKKWMVFATAGSQLIQPDHLFLSAGFAVDIF